MITFACPHCVRVLRVREEFAGRQGKCPHCQQAIRAPTPSAVQAAPILAMVAEEEAEAPAATPAAAASDSAAPSTAKGAGSAAAAFTTQVQSGPAPATAPPPRPVSVPGYEILCELGRGGMGVVYRAKQADLNRLVALKMILAGQFAT